MTGIMFRIEKDHGLATDFDVLYVMEYAEGMQAERMHNRSREESRQDVSQLVEDLQDAGFDIAYDEVTRTASIVTPNADDLTLCKTRFFASTLDQLKKQVQDMSIQTFATDPFAVYELRRLCEDPDNNMAYYNGVIYKLHQLLRRLEPNETYYIGQKTIQL